MASKKTNLRGFTLIEMTTVIGVTVLLVFILYQVLLVSNNSFRAGDQGLELIQNGRIVLDRLSRELRQSVEIVTVMPVTKTDPLLDPPTEILFQDGHNLTDIQYIRYYLDGTDLKRQRIVYTFSEEPNTYVYWDAIDAFSQSPDATVIDEKIIAEYISNIIYYGADLKNIEIFLNLGDSATHFFTSIWGRNNRH